MGKRKPQITFEDNGDRVDVLLNGDKIGCLFPETNEIGVYEAGRIHADVMNRMLRELRSRVSRRSTAARSKLNQQVLEL